MSGYKYNLLLQKRYFDIGYGFTSVLKYLIALFAGVNAVITKEMSAVIIAGLAYVVFCYLFGLAFVKFGWYEADIEIENRFNLFVKEMRKVYK